MRRRPLRSPLLTAVLCMASFLTTLGLLERTADAATAYIRSTVSAPWGSTSNEQAMDLVFGVGYADEIGTALEVLERALSSHSPTRSRS